MRKLAAGNWKMNGGPSALAEVAALKARIGAPKVEVVLCPPATLLAPLAAAAGPALGLGGQDCHPEASGAFTGDISAPLLQAAGAAYVILGHSERRAGHGESDSLIAAKGAAALAAGLRVILCLGESEAERMGGQTLARVGAQLAASLPAGATPENYVIAYEPIWAIGTGRTPSLEEIAEVHAFLRQSLLARWGAGASACRLLYGGSVKPGNAAAIFALPHVDGALVGGASLKADDFAPIIEALAAA